MNFQSQLLESLRRIAEQLDRRTSRIALEAYRRLNEGSPIDRGTFRANWNVSEGEIDRRTDLTMTIESFPLRETRGKIVLENRARSGAVIYFANSVPYAIRLENGYSRQSPGGIVAPVVESLAKNIEQGELDEDRQ